MEYAVIGRSETYPILYHMNQTLSDAERLRQRRERAIGRPCFVVTMAAWATNPRTALQDAEAAREHAAESTDNAGRGRYGATGGQGKAVAPMIAIGACVRFVGANPGTQRRSSGRVGTVRHLATWQGAIGTPSPTACVAWSTSVNDWSYVLLGELVVVSAS